MNLRFNITFSNIFNPLLQILFMLSERLSQIPPSETLALNARVKELEGRGKNVLNFTAGEPDFPTPGNIKRAGIRAIRDNFTRYTPAPGMPELREAICRKLKKDNKLDCSPQEVLVSCGAKHSLYNAMQALCNPGDRVLIPSPYWLSYPEMVKLAGAIPVFVELGEPFKLRAGDVEGRLSGPGKVKALILNSPNNPAGAVYEREELERIAELAAERDFWIISDEIYEKLVYDGKRHFSIASVSGEVRQRTLTINGVSKSYSMTGWRIGYAAGPGEVIKLMSNLQSHSTSNPCSVAQKAALEALEGPQGSVRRMRMEFDRRRKLIVGGLNRMGLKCPMPEGAFYAFPSISETGMCSHAFSEFMLENAGVALVPGRPFGSDRHVRISYACSRENIKEGLERIGKALNTAGK